MTLPHVIATVLAMSLLADAGIAAVEDSGLTPKSQWQLDYAASECRLLRTFGEGRDTVTVQFSRLGSDDDPELSLAGQRMPETEDDLPAKVTTSTVSQVPGMHARGFAASRGSPGVI
jgi:hypothetical protein